MPNIPTIYRVTSTLQDEPNQNPEMHRIFSGARETRAKQTAAILGLGGEEHATQAIPGQVLEIFCYK